jgi:hypothetical protein
VIELGELPLDDASLLEALDLALAAERQDPKRFRVPSEAAHLPLGAACG